MAFPNPKNSSLKLHELCRIAPPPSSPKSSFSLTFFDLIWLRLYPVQRLFFFSVPHLQPSSFFDTIVPKLKHSLSLSLQHFLPLAGNIVWPSDSLKPIVQYNPGDSVSLAIALSDSDMNSLIEKSPRDASQSHAFVPNLDSSDSSASVLSLQITLFPNRGFSIGITSHHACADGKSSTMFIKAWAYLCRTEAENESFGLLPQELEPLLDREVILDPSGIAGVYINNMMSGLDPNQKKKPSLKIMYDVFRPKVEDSARATFELKRGDLDKIKERVLQKWENHETKEEREDSKLPKPQTLSTFVLASAYVLFCIGKAMERTKQGTNKMVLNFLVDYRTRLELPIPENYFGNCVMPHIVEDLMDEDGVVIVAKKLHRKISKIQKEIKEVLDGSETFFFKLSSLLTGGNHVVIGVSGSNRFRVYQADFGWGRPEKVEITSAGRNTMAMAEGKDGDGGVEVGLVLKNQVMDQFASLFQTEIGCF